MIRDVGSECFGGSFFFFLLFDYRVMLNLC